VEPDAKRLGTSFSPTSGQCNEDTLGCNVSRTQEPYLMLPTYLLQEFGLSSAAYLLPTMEVYASPRCGPLLPWQVAFAGLFRTCSWWN